MLQRMLATEDRVAALQRIGPAMPRAVWALWDAKQHVDIDAVDEWIYRGIEITKGQLLSSVVQHRESLQDRLRDSTTQEAARLGLEDSLRILRGESWADVSRVRFDLAAKIATRTGSLDALFGAGPSLPSDLGRSLPVLPKAVVLSLLTDPDNHQRVLAVGVEQSRVWTAALGSPETHLLTYAVEDYRERFGDLLTWAIPDTRDFADAYEDFIKPIRDKLSGASILYFVPDRDLADFPFEALLDRFEGEYLIEQFQIMHASSGRALAWQLSREPVRGSGSAAVVSLDIEHARESATDVLGQISDGGVISSWVFDRREDVFLPPEDGMAFIRRVLLVIAHGDRGSQHHFTLHDRHGRVWQLTEEIGRASCRERV